MSRKLLVHSCLALAALGMSSASKSTLTVFTDPGLFNAAILAAGVDTYDDLSGSGQATPLSRSTSGTVYTYQAATGASGFFPAGSAADRWLATDTATDSIVLDTFIPTVGAIGGFFFNSDINGGFQSGRNVTVVVEDGDDTETVTLLSTTVSTFRGFLSDGQIGKLTITADNTASGQTNPFTWATINDLTLGSAGDQPSIPTPEPGTLALIGFAALGLGASRRRKA